MIKWMEIIKLRVAENIQESLLRRLTEHLADINQAGGLTEIKLFHNAVVNSDLSIHLYWETAQIERQGSTPGLCLIHVFKAYGLISHSLWIETAGCGNLELALSDNELIPAVKEQR